MKKLFNMSAAVTAVVLCMGTVTQASLTVVGTLGGVPVSGVNYVNFNDLTLGSGSPQLTANIAGSANVGTVKVDIVADGQAVQGSQASQYAAPSRSFNQGTLFGSPANGADTTTYVTSGSGGNAGVTLTFAAGQKYLGLLWGSVDSYNQLELFDGNTSVGVVNVLDVIALPTGDQSADGTRYVNIDSTLAFNKVVFTSTSKAFEFDDVAYGVDRIVPEATTIAVWSGLSLLGWVAYRRHSS